MVALAEIQIVPVAGTPEARGRAHGEALRSLIVAGMERWKDSIHEATGMHPAAYLDRFVNETNFMPAIERWTPHLLDEVRGIAAGAGIAFRDVYAYQLVDEEWTFRPAYMKEESEPLEHCSMLGVFGEDGGPTILAQNMDLPKYYDGTQTLLHVAHHDSDLESFIFTPAGLIGTTGLNNRSLGLCVNTLAPLRSAPHGLPVAFVVRGILEHETLDEAVAFARDVAHASGQNYALGSPGRIVDIECSATKAVPFTVGPTRVYHTNHPLANDDRAPQPDDPNAVVFGTGDITEAEPVDAPALSNSKQRFAFLASALDEPTTRITLDAVKAILRTCDDAPLSVSRTSAGHGMTLGSLVMELSIPPVLHLSPGPPAETAYRRWAF